MQVLSTELPGLLLVQPRVFPDPRGFFVERYQRQRYHDAGINIDFVQDNHSRSSRGALRGLHYQIEHPQGKLVGVTQGEVYDVAVDMRRGSPTFGRWLGFVLSEQNQHQLYVPPGFAHGFCVVSETADFVYKCTDYYFPEHERVLLWNDPELAIPWPIENPILSGRDAQGVRFADAPYFEMGA